MLHMWLGYKVHASHSADGLNWRPYNQGRPVLFIPPGHDSHMVPYWDGILGSYVAIVRDRTGRIPEVRPRLATAPEAVETWRRLWDPRRERHPRNHSLRRVGQALSQDFLHWTDYRPILGADGEDSLNRDQFYNMEVLVYDGLRLGLMTVFSYDPEYCRGAVQLTYSRDGRHWRRAGDRRVFLPLSQRPGDFDWGSIYPLQAPLLVGDEIWIYYTGFGVDHNHRLPPRGLARDQRHRPGQAQAGWIRVAGGRSGRGKPHHQALHFRRGTPDHQRRRPSRTGSGGDPGKRRSPREGVWQGRVPDAALR